MQPIATPRSGAGRWGFVVLLTAALVSLLGAAPAAAQQNPLPDKAANVVIGAPDFVTSSDGDGLDQVYYAYDAVIDPVTKKVFVADFTNDRVLRFADYRTLQNGDAAEHVFGGSCPALEAPTATCFLPFAIELDGAGRLWVLDDYHRLLRYDNAVTSTSAAFDAQLGWNAGAYGTSVDFWELVVTGADGDTLIVHDINNRQFMYWDISGTPADGKLPYQTLPAALFNQEADKHYSSLAYDATTGGLWILDYHAGCVRYYANPEDLSAPRGVIGSTTADCSRASVTGLSATEMSRLSGLWVSADGTLFVGDSDNYRILAFRDAAARAKTALQNGTAVSADAVYGAADFDTPGYPSPTAPGVNPAEYIGYLYEFGGDPSGNTLVIPMEDPSSVRLFIAPDPPPPTPVPQEEAIVTACATLPDMAISPERIELAAGGTTTVTVTLRNRCDDLRFEHSDLLVSLSDGLRVVDGSADMLNLGRRAAWQGLSLAPAETRSWQLTVQSDTTLPTAPLHVAELYFRGGVALRIDGVFVGATPVAADTAVAVLPADTTAASVPIVPATLPNTMGQVTPANTLVAPAWLMVLMLGGALLLLRRRG